MYPFTHPSLPHWLTFGTENEARAAAEGLAAGRSTADAGANPYIGALRLEIAWDHGFFISLKERDMLARRAQRAKSYAPKTRP